MVRLTAIGAASSSPPTNPMTTACGRWKVRNGRAYVDKSGWRFARGCDAAVGFQKKTDPIGCCADSVGPSKRALRVGLQGAEIVSICRLACVPGRAQQQERLILLMRRNLMKRRSIGPTTAEIRVKAIGVDQRGRRTELEAAKAVSTNEPRCGVQRSQMPLSSDQCERFHRSVQRRCVVLPHHRLAGVCIAVAGSLNSQTPGQAIKLKLLPPDSGEKN